MAFTYKIKPLEWEEKEIENYNGKVLRAKNSPVEISIKHFNGYDIMVSIGSYYRFEFYKTMDEAKAVAEEEYVCELKKYLEQV